MHACLMQELAIAALAIVIIENNLQPSCAEIAIISF